MNVEEGLDRIRLAQNWIHWECLCAHDTATFWLHKCVKFLELLASADFSKRSLNLILSVIIIAVGIEHETFLVLA